MNIDDFLNKYQYVKGSSWSGWRNISSAPFEGDCNDFALTVLLLEEGGWFGAIMAILTFKAVFWLVKSPANDFFPRHIVLHHRKKGWIDSTVRNWRSDPAPHKLIMPLLFPWAYFRMAWGMLNSLISNVL